MAKELEGKVAVVTGAARNQGRAYSEMLAGHGANVVVHHRGESSRAEAEKTADAVRRQGPKAVFVQADLTQVPEEIGHRGITVNTVAPGPLDTSFFYPAETPDSIAYLTQASVQTRLGTIEDIVPLIELLVLPKGGWITGQTLFIKGGFTTR